jgi:hypothetical protein
MQSGISGRRDGNGSLVPTSSEGVNQSSVLTNGAISAADYERLGLGNGAVR